MGYDADYAFRDCPWCGVTQAQMLLLARDMEAQGTRSGAGERTYTLLACPRCAGPIVLETNGDGPNPPKLLRTLPLGSDAHKVEHLPDDVLRYYTAAVTVLNAGVPDAAAVQLRRTLEASALHVGIRERNLITAIQKMIEQGLITSAFGQVLDHIRKVGNIGAHASDETIDQATAERALSFTTQVLRNLFEIPAELAGIETPTLFDGP